MAPGKRFKHYVRSRKKHFSILVPLICFSASFYYTFFAAPNAKGLKIQAFGTNSNWLLGRKPLGQGYIEMTEAKTETLAGNDKCVIVSCFDKHAPGIHESMEYYKSFGYTMRRVVFNKVLAGGKETVQPWCRIPAVIDASYDFPNSRILYLDLDTKVNPRVWCNLPDNREHAPIIMNSFTRPVRKVIPNRYSMYGTQVQANAFIVTHGSLGRKAIRRWRDSFENVFLHDQGVIHMREQGLCGVPGWIHCYRNPNQQKCHCAAMKGERKLKCIDDLYKGKKEGCNV